MSVAAIVLAAGRGERLGPGQPKALRALGGVPMLVHAVRALSRARLVDLVVVAAPADAVRDVTSLLALHHRGAEVLVVAGGVERQHSVACALKALPDDVAVVLVHDAARALAPSDLADRVAAAVLGGHRAVVPGLPLADTVKRVRGAEAADGVGDRARRDSPATGAVDSSAETAVEVVIETLPRPDLRVIQTPQGFDRRLLETAHAEASWLATDDAGLIERLGVAVAVVPGSPEAFKITRPIDLVLAEAILAERREHGSV